MKLTTKGTWNLVLVLIIFTCTGLTSVYLSAIIMNFLGAEKWSLTYILGYLFIIIPVYHVILLFYAFIFGRFDYFWSRIKKILRLLKSFFSKG